MKGSQNRVGLRRHRLLPIAVLVLLLVCQSIVFLWLPPISGPQYILYQMLFYMAIGVVIVWITRRFREQAIAEDHLRHLYKVTGEVTRTADMDDLIEIALRMPESVLEPVGTSLILREDPEGSWRLASTRYLETEQREAMEAFLTTVGSRLRCGQCVKLSATARQNCPLRPPLLQGSTQELDISILCLPLSTERPSTALLNVYVAKEEGPPPATRQLLESMTSGLAMALDYARLCARESQMLQHMEEAVRQQDGLGATLGHILSDVAAAHQAKAGTVFLVSRGEGTQALIPLTSWPGEENTYPHLSALALQALREGDLVLVDDGSENGHVAAIPLVTDDLSMGALVLAGRRPFTTSQLTFLRVAAGMMALVIRNSQLYAELESQAVLEERSRLAREVHDGLAQSLGFLNFKLQQVDRLLAREQWESARQATQELREGVQEIYSEVRLTIHDLRWPPENGQGLVESLRQYVAAFAARADLDISLTVEGEPDLSPREEVHLFRVAQEALANVHKHAQARHVGVHLLSGPEGTILEVKDDGAGLPADSLEDQESPEVSGHFGFRIMRERVEAIGGRLSLHSVPGQGTRLQVTVKASPNFAQYPSGTVP